MIKRERGITLVSLIITISLMLIISSIVVTMSLERFEINSLRKLKNDLEVLEDKISNYYLKYGVLPVLRNSNDNTPIIYDYTMLDFDKDSADSGNYYIIDLEAIDGGLLLNYGRDGFENPNLSQDVFVVNETSHTVYYVRGIELNDQWHHYLNENGTITDNIPPSKPEIKVVSGTEKRDASGNIYYITDVEIEIIPGKDSLSGVKGTNYSLDGGTTWYELGETSNVFKITEEGIHTIIAKSYDKSTSKNYSEQTLLTIEIVKKFSWTQDKTTVTNGKVVLEVGQTVSGYDAGVESYNGVWCVLGAEAGKLLLVSQSNVQEDVTFGGASGGNVTIVNSGLEYTVTCEGGYYNGVNVLNDICSGYKNTTLADGVRSIKAEDINRITGFNPQKAENGYPWGNDTYKEYGTEVTYKMTSSNTVQLVWGGGNTLDGELGEDATFVLLGKKEPLETNEEVTITNSYYTYNASDYMTNSVSKDWLSKYGNTFLNNYWLANSYINPGATNIGYGLFIARDQKVIGGELYGTDYLNNTAEAGVRAVITLKSNVNVDSLGVITLTTP